MPFGIEKYSKRTLRGRRWYWRFVHENGNIMGDSSEAYNSSQARDKAIETIVSKISKNQYVIRDGDLGDQVK